MGVKTARRLEHEVFQSACLPLPPSLTFVRGAFKGCDGLADPMCPADVLWWIHTRGSWLVLLRKAQVKQIIGRCRMG